MKTHLFSTGILLATSHAKGMQIRGSSQNSLAVPHAHLNTTYFGDGFPSSIELEASQNKTYCLEQNLKRLASCQGDETGEYDILDNSFLYHIEYENFCPKEAYAIEQGYFLDDSISQCEFSTPAPVTTTPATTNALTTPAPTQPEKSTFWSAKNPILYLAGGAFTVSCVGFAFVVSRLGKNGAENSSISSVFTRENLLSKA
jgi:hypothetical protein